METAVALPTLTPLQISFGRGGKKEKKKFKKRHAGWEGLCASLGVRGGDGSWQQHLLSVRRYLHLHILTGSVLN